MINVEAIEWLSEEAEEAIVHFSDGNFGGGAFSHPCRAVVGERINEPLIAFNCSDVRATSEEVFLARHGGGLSHEFVGVLVDKNKRRVAIGEVFIELDIPVPGDVGEGEHVHVYCERLDLY